MPQTQAKNPAPRMGAGFLACVCGYKKVNKELKSSYKAMRSKQVDLQLTPVIECHLIIFTGTLSLKKVPQITSNSPRCSKKFCQGDSLGKRKILVQKSFECNKKFPNVRGVENGSPVRLHFHIKCPTHKPRTPPPEGVSGSWLAGGAIRR